MQASVCLFRCRSGSVPRIVQCLLDCSRVPCVPTVRRPAVHVIESLDVRDLLIPTNGNRGTREQTNPTRVKVRNKPGNTEGTEPSGVNTP